MSKIVFITSLTENYQPQAQRLLSSLKLLKSVEPYVMTLDFSLPDGDGYRAVRADIPLPLRTCPQQGHLIDLVPGLTDNDLAIIADADACIQRDLLREELHLLGNLGDRVGLSNNACEGQNAFSEAVVCRPLVPITEIERKLGVQLKDVPIFNCGFVVAKPPTWRKVRLRFEQLWPVIQPMFQEWRCCQLALCLAFHLARIEVVNVGYGMHTQGHFTPQKLHDIRDGVLYYGNRPVFFVHHVDGFW